MKTKSNRLKILCLLFFTAFAVASLVDDDRIVPSTAAFSGGPPAGVTGAPGEVTCAVCHGEAKGAGSFSITPPQNYTPGANLSDRRTARYERYIPQTLGIRAYGTGRNDAGRFVHKHQPDHSDAGGSRRPTLHRAYLRWDFCQSDRRSGLDL